MKYDIEADWILLRNCNFSCQYCFPAINRSSGPIQKYGSPAEWAAGFDRTGKTWLLHISGGEPSIYPDFVQLCLQLTQNHYISINSNISHRSIGEFTRNIDPERVLYINAAIHYEERTRRASFKDFFLSIQQLQKANFNVFLSVVMTPYVVDNFAQITELFKAQGLSVIPKVMRASFDGQSYPKAYTPVQLDLIRSYLQEAQKNYRPVLGRMVEPPTINMFSDYEIFIAGNKDYQGRLCEAGAKFVKITPDGIVSRCFSSRMYGNILLNNLKLMNKPEVCNTYYCPYFCEKYSVCSQDQ